MLKEILSEGDDATYKWKPTMLVALKKLKSIDNPRYRSNVFWELYSDSLAEPKEEGSSPSPQLKAAELDERPDTYKRLLKKIESQLEDPKHPFRVLQQNFDQYVENEYVRGGLPEFSIMTRLIKDITDIVQVMCYATIYFYNLKLKLTPKNSELFLGAMTDLFLRGTTQKIIMQNLREEVATQAALFRAKLEKFRKIRLDQLKVSQYLAFDPAFRNTHKLKNPGGSLPKETKPLEKSIEELLKVKSFAEPNKKLEQLYAFSKKIVAEVDEFWKDFEVKRDHLIMDPDSLLSLYIFCIIKGEYLEVLADHKYMEIFITDVDRKSAKGYHLVTLGIAFEWILSQSDFINFSLVAFGGFLNDFFFPLP